MLFSEKGVIMKKLWILLLTLSLIFCFASCGGASDCDGAHKDSDGDGLCDVCGEDVGSSPAPLDGLKLIEDGFCNFHFVVASGLGSDIHIQLDSIVKGLKTIGLYTDVYTDTKSNEIECEVLIGNVQSRGEEYFYDVHTLGKEGYVIKRIGTKVIVNADALDSLSFAVEAFTKKVLGFEEGKTSELKADYVILSVGYTPAPVAEKAKNVHIIGDAKAVGNLRTVIWNAWDVAMKI
jgi:hypothetical protein